MSTTLYEGRFGAITLASNGHGRGLRAEMQFNGNGELETTDHVELRRLALALWVAADKVEFGPCQHSAVQSDGAIVWCARCLAPMQYDPATGGYRPT